MKVSAAALALVAATALLCVEPVASAAPVRVQHAPPSGQVPLQVNKQTDTREWRAPVVDKKRQSEPADSPTKQQQQHDAVFKKKSVHLVPRTDHARNRESSTKMHLNAKPQSKKRSSSTEEQAPDAREKRASQSARRAPHAATRSIKKSGSKRASASKSAALAPPRAPDTRRSDGAGGLSNAAQDSMVNRQSYSELQIGAETRSAGAAVMTQMAESFRAETNKSLAFLGTVAGLVVGAVIVIVALVTLSRQSSEFAAVGLEGDVPDLESGRVQDVDRAEEEVTAGIRADANREDEQAEAAAATTEEHVCGGNADRSKRSIVRV